MSDLAWIVAAAGLAGALFLGGLVWVNRRAYGCGCGHGASAHALLADGSRGGCRQLWTFWPAETYPCPCERYDEEVR